MASRGLNAVVAYIRIIGAVGKSTVLTDGTLLERFLASRDEEAFNALIQRHGPLVLTVCQRVLNNVQDAEDAFQATFVILLRNAPSIAKRESVASWLHGVAHRIALRAKADIMRRQSAERQAPRTPPADTLNEVVWRDLRLVLDEEIQGLPERYRAPFILCYMEGRTNEEAARLLGCPSGTVMSRLARARERLRNGLVRRGLDLSAALVATRLSQSAVTAAVPTKLAGLTLKAVLQLRNGAAAAGVLAPNVATLVRVMAKSLWFQKATRNLAILVLATSFVGIGVSALASLARTEGPGEQNGGLLEPPNPQQTERGSTNEKYPAALTLRAKQPLDQSVRALRVSCRVGHIKVVRSPDADMVVTAVVRANTDHVDPATITNAFEHHVRVDKSDGVLTIADAHKDAADCEDWWVSLEVALPRALSAELRTVMGDLTVEFATGSVSVVNDLGHLKITSDELTSVSAESATGHAVIQIGKVTEKLLVKTGTGRISLRLADLGSRGDVTLITSVGDVMLDLPRKAAGRFSMETGRGSIAAEGLPGVRVQRNETQTLAKGTVGEKGPLYKVSTGWGDITAKAAN